MHPGLARLLQEETDEVGSVPNIAWYGLYSRLQ